MNNQKEPFAHTKMLHREHYKRLYQLAKRLGIEGAPSLPDAVIWEKIGRILGNREAEFRDFPKPLKPRGRPLKAEIGEIEIAELVDAHLRANPQIRSTKVALEDLKSRNLLSNSGTISSLQKAVATGRGLLRVLGEAERAERLRMEESQRQADLRLREGRRRDR